MVVLSTNFGADRVCKGNLIQLLLSSRNSSNFMSAYISPEYKLQSDLK